MEGVLRGTPILRRFIYLHHGLSRTSSFVLSGLGRKYHSCAVHRAVNKEPLEQTRSQVFRPIANQHKGIIQSCLLNTGLRGDGAEKHRKLSSFPAEFSRQPALKSPIRLIDRNGKSIGVVSIEEARQIANERELLMQVVRFPTSQSQETICKLATKQEFVESSKKKKEAEKRVKQTTKVKEITLKSSIAETDLLRKISKVQEFLSDDYRVKVFIRGRRASAGNVKPLADRIIETLQDSGRLDGKLTVSEESAKFSIVPQKH